MNKKNNKINKLILGWGFVISLIILTLSVIVFNLLETNPNPEKNNLTKDVENLKTENKNEITTENQKEITTPNEITTTTPILATKPYLKYYDSEGNIIREYLFFQNMHPTQKDIKGRTVFFDKKDFEDCLNKIGISCYPLQWSHGRDHLGEYEFESDGNEKLKYGWPVSKSNYQFIQTNKPYAKTNLLTRDKHGDDDFYNRSNCFLNTCQNIDIFNVITELDDYSKIPYLRLITKNLELEFDWLYFISKEFKDYCSDCYKNISNYIYCFDPSANLEDLKYDIRNLSSADFKSFQVLHRFNNNIDFDKFDSDYQKNIYLQYNRQDLIDWLKNLDLKDNEKLIKIREWAIYNIEQEQQQQEPEFTKSNNEEFM
ncbi:MAG: hypothetical protein Q8781_00250 [Candidatus Phytoplasma stylosanthis]|uniref:hypothetical protein n=1 Tax=Candidatus Phytoplasma stylosanthis TaxID=2798314 RepID=UPI002939BEE4|nr:hypothetical protein [Candidatus Phytoplasma stylosanthis]MDV3167890.1 hypothetical protein [Candidatus Phytoplasma stylosanthis]MDV3170725.1 hypothetical protein [Candidatus Phytoplasma stylosanthis]MDV3173982.1 hypothetical protein [Candidatus Phytoplasma stylosanthis]